MPISIQEEHAKKGDPLPAIVPPGPDNPLGQFAMRLGLPGYLIHGTNKPYGIGMRVSHGCIHLYPEDIAKLFETIPVGVDVNIINKPYTAGWHNNTLYIEAHTPLEEDVKILDGSLTPAIKEVVRVTKTEDRANVNWSRLIRVAQHHPGFPVPISMSAPSLGDMFETLSVINDDLASTEQATAKTAEGSAMQEIGQRKEQLSRMPEAAAVTTQADSTNTNEIATPNGVMATPSPEPQTTPVSAPASTNWYIQAGNFKSEDNAQRLTSQLRAMKPAIAAQYVSTSTGHRVLAGPFSSKDEARLSQNRILAQLGIETLIKPVAERRTSAN